MTDTNLDRAAKMAGVSKYYGKKADPLAVSSIRAHAATLDELDAAKAELEALKREVSEVCRDVRLHDGLHKLDRFILPKPDPLVEAIKDLSWDETTAAEEWAADLRAALAKRGLKLVEVGDAD